MEREDSWDDLGASTAAPRRRDLPTTSQPSVGDFEAVYEPGSRPAGTSSRSTSPRGLSGTCESAREAARVARPRGLAGPGRGRRRPDRRRRARLRGPRRRELRPTRVRRDAGRRRGPPDPRVAGDVVLPRHARVPAPRRPDRRGAGPARIGAEDQADPHLRTEITPVGKVRTKSRALQRMGPYIEELRDRGATDWIVQHAQSPGGRGLVSERGDRSSASRRCSARRSAPFSGPTSARGCWSAASASPPPPPAESAALDDRQRRSRRGP